MTFAILPLLDSSTQSSESPSIATAPSPAANRQPEAEAVVVAVGRADQLEAVLGKVLLDGPEHGVDPRSPPPAISGSR